MMHPQPSTARTAVNGNAAVFWAGVLILTKEVGGIVVTVVMGAGVGVGEVKMSAGDAVTVEECSSGLRFKDFSAMIDIFESVPGSLR
jgi:hypothetical protein